MSHWTAVVVQSGAWRQTGRGRCWLLAARMARCVHIDDVKLREYLHLLIPIASTLHFTSPFSFPPFLPSFLSPFLPSSPSSPLLPPPPLHPFLPLSSPYLPVLLFPSSSASPPLSLVSFHDTTLASLLRFTCLTLPQVGEVSHQHEGSISKRAESSPLLGIPQGSSSQWAEQTAQFGK